MVRPLPFILAQTPHTFSIFTPVIGKAEGLGPEWHGHVTALTVAPEYRRLSLARKMMDLLEHVSDNSYRGFFVDLYVRCTNVVAIGMYEELGYSVYRRVREYYGSLGLGRSAKDEEDAFGEYKLNVVLHIADLLGGRHAKTVVERFWSSLYTCQWPRVHRHRSGRLIGLL